MKQERRRLRYKGFSIKIIEDTYVYLNRGKKYVFFLGVNRIVNNNLTEEEAITEAKQAIDTFINNDYKEFDDDEIVSLMEVYSHCRNMRKHIINQIRN